MSEATEPTDAGRSVRRFLDADDRVKVWPSKLKDQKLVLSWLAARFEPGHHYAEREVNAILKRSHTFEDWALLRRALIDYRFLERLGDGSRYWRRESDAQPDPSSGPARPASP